MLSSIYRILRPVKRRLQVLRGRDLFLHEDVELQTKKLGSDYGGWVVPADSITSSSIVYSAGIGTDISFDLALIAEYGARVHAFDPTPKSLAWLEEQELPAQFHYHPWGFADYDGIAAFHTPRNSTHVSHSMVASQVTTAEKLDVEVRRIQSVMKELEHDKLDLLKMDIEGAEYKVIEDLLAASIYPRLLLVEFHHRFKSIGSKMTKKAVAALRGAGYRLYSVSESGEECCFIL